MIVLLPYTVELNSHNAKPHPQGKMFCNVGCNPRIYTEPES